mmetsp:Transcript_114490/g.255483  ORF Transcript_114490/g.255483 Transcript_114490/m.255483 type:complete len:265 (-) Transcript_114490:15-809(-)
MISPSMTGRGTKTYHMRPFGPPRFISVLEALRTTAERTQHLQTAATASSRSDVKVHAGSSTILRKTIDLGPGVPDVARRHGIDVDDVVARGRGVLGKAHESGLADVLRVEILHLVLLPCIRGVQEALRQGRLLLVYERGVAPESVEQLELVLSLQDRVAVTFFDSVFQCQDFGAVLGQGPGGLPLRIRPCGRHAEGCSRNSPRRAAEHRLPPAAHGSWRQECGRREDVHGHVGGQGHQGQREQLSPRHFAERSKSLSPICSSQP